MDKPVLKTTLTTGEIALLCGVASRTATQWCDIYGLKHYRLPGSKDRRVPRSALYEFLRKYNVPLHGYWLLLVCGGPPPIHLPPTWQTREAHTPFDIGFAVGQLPIGNALLYASALGRNETVLLSKKLTANHVAVYIIPGDDDTEQDRARYSGTILDASEAAKGEFLTPPVLVKPKRVRQCKTQN